MTLKIKKRCIRCLKVLREDGTCQNPDCPRYVPEKETMKEPTQETTEADNGKAKKDGR